MHTTILKVCTAITVWRAEIWHEARTDRGEGIVSVAIAVLIMASLGVVAYGAFNVLFTSTTDAAETQIGNIGG
jgi:hypothetical protein